MIAPVVRESGKPARRTVFSAGLALVLLLLAQPAHAQDVTVLVVALVPPILLAPVFLVCARWFWLRRFSPSPARIVLLAGVSCVEVLLWVVFIASTVVIMTGDWDVQVVFWPVVSCAALWMLSRIWFDPSQRAARWIFFASPPLVLALLAAATWWVLLVTWK